MKRSEDPNDLLIQRLTELSLVLASRLASRGGARDISAAMSAILGDIAGAPGAPLYHHHLTKMATGLAAMTEGDKKIIAEWKHAPTFGPRRI